MVSLVDDGNISDRLVALGTRSDGLLAPKEVFAAARFEAVSTRKLVSRAPDGPNGTSGGDFIDDTGELWDAVGPLKKSALKEDGIDPFLNSIETKHIDKPDKGSVIVDLAGLPPTEKESIRKLVQRRLQAGETVADDIELTLDTNRKIILLGD